MHHAQQCDASASLPRSGHKIDPNDSILLIHSFEIYQYSKKQIMPYLKMSSVVVLSLWCHDLVPRTLLLDDEGFVLR